MDRLLKDLIKEFEGYRSESYLDSANVWTIGYGTTRSISKGLKINEYIAELLLEKDLEIFEKFINKVVTVPITDNQYNALVSLCYNIGVGNFGRSTLLKKLNKSDYEGASNEFTRWVYAGGKKLNGLLRRRIKEQSLFNSP